MSAERHLHHGYGELANIDFNSQPFSLAYANKPDVKKGIPSQNVTLNFPEGSFYLKPELSSPLNELCNALKIEVPHCDHDLPSFVRSCLYIVDGETYQKKPHFEDAVIPFLFPNGDLEAHKARKFLKTADAPAEADQCCEIKGKINEEEQGVHLHGPYQGDNKSRLALLSLMGYEPAQDLLIKLVGKQPEFQGKSKEDVFTSVAETIVKRKTEQKEEMISGHEHHKHDHDDSVHEAMHITAKPLEKFPAAETIPSHELGVWGKSLEIVTDAALNLTLMHDHIDAETRESLEKTVMYRLGFSPDPRHLLHEEVVLNRCCDAEITKHLKEKIDVIDDVSVDQIAQAVLLMRSVNFGQEEQDHLTHKLHSLDEINFEKEIIVEELRPTLNYALKFEGNEATLSYSQILQVIALGMGIQAKSKNTEFTSKESKIIKLSSVFNEYGFTLSNFRSDSNDYVQKNPFMIFSGQSLQLFEKAVASNDLTALQDFRGVDAHNREEDMVGFHGTIRLENGKIIQEMCAEHAEEVASELQKIEQVNEILKQQININKAENQLLGAPLRLNSQIYPILNSKGVVNSSELGQLNHGVSYLRMESSSPQGHKTTSSGRDSSKPINLSGARRGNSKSPEEVKAIKNNARKKIIALPSRPRRIEFKHSAPSVTVLMPKPRAEVARSKVLIQGAPVRSKKPSVLESKPVVKQQEVVAAGNSITPILFSANPDSISTTPWFRAGRVDAGPAKIRRIKPTKPKSYKPRGSGEVNGNAIEAPSVTIGTNLSRAFEKLDEVRLDSTEVSSGNAQSQRIEQATAGLSDARQKEKIEVDSKEKGAREVSGSAKASKDSQKADATVSQATQSRGYRRTTLTTDKKEQDESRGSTVSVDVEEAIKFSSRERATSMREASDISEVAVSQGTDERNEQAQGNQAGDVSQRARAKKTTTNKNKATGVRQSSASSSMSLALAIDNENLDFTNPHGVGDAFRKALKNALAA